MEVDLKTPTKRNHDGAWIVLRPEDFIAPFDMQTVFEMGAAGDQTKKNHPQKILKCWREAIRAFLKNGLLPATKMQ